jgi:hypothetical protein
MDPKARKRVQPGRALPIAAARCRRKFLRYFPDGFDDETYVDWERGYKQKAHASWQRDLGRAEMHRLLLRGEHREIAQRAVRIESRTNLLFSFEKMALRDAVRNAAGAKLFAEGLRDFLYGRGGRASRFERWGEVLAALPRKQTRVHTWPLHTVFGFIAGPDRDIFLKPNVTRIAARAYDFDFRYQSRPSWATYASLLEFAETVRSDQRDLGPRDMIDLQGFIWVLGSDEYP